jgi:hypothetical protein
MIGAITSTVKAVASPLFKLIDAIHTSEDEKNRAKVEVETILQDMTSGIMAVAQSIISAQKEIMVAEMKGNFLQRTWRPIAMLVFVYMIFHNHVLLPVFGIPPVDLSERIWDIIQWGLTGYIGGRSAEKIATTIASGIGTRLNK